MLPTPPTISIRPPRCSRRAIPIRYCRSTEPRMMAWNISSITSSETPQASACWRARVSTRSSTSRTTTGRLVTALTRPTSPARSMRRRSSSRRARSTSAMASRRSDNGSGELMASLREERRFYDGEEGREAERGRSASPRMPRDGALPRVGWVKRVQPSHEQRQCHRANPDGIRAFPASWSREVNGCANRYVLWGRQAWPRFRSLP
jgi:hypothetical protein